MYTGTSACSPVLIDCFNAFYLGFRAKLVLQLMHGCIQLSAKSLKTALTVVYSAKHSTGHVREGNNKHCHPGWPAQPLAPANWAVRLQEQNNRQEEEGPGHLRACFCPSVQQVAQLLYQSLVELRVFAGGGVAVEVHQRYFHWQALFNINWGLNWCCSNASWDCNAPLACTACSLADWLALTTDHCFYRKHAGDRLFENEHNELANSWAWPLPTAQSRGHAVRVASRWPTTPTIWPALHNL